MLNHYNYTELILLIYFFKSLFYTWVNMTDVSSYWYLFTWCHSYRADIEGQDLNVMPSNTTFIIHELCRLHLLEFMAPCSYCQSLAVLLFLLIKISKLLAILFVFTWNLFIFFYALFHYNFSLLEECVYITFLKLKLEIKKIHLKIFWKF